MQRILWPRHVKLKIRPIRRFFTETREKGKQLINLSTGSYISLVVAREGVEGVDREKVGGHEPRPSASWVENTIKTECTQESGHLQSIYSLVCVSDSDSKNFV
jgi:hypothetical protein